MLSVVHGREWERSPTSMQIKRIRQSITVQDLTEK